MPRQAPSSKRYSVGQSDRLLGRQRDGAGRRPEGALPLRVPDPDPLAEARRVDARPDPVDHAGAVAVRDHPRGQHRARARAGLPVGGVHARGVNVHPHLARAGLRVRHLAETGAPRGPDRCARTRLPAWGASVQIRSGAAACRCVRRRAPCGSRRRPRRPSSRCGRAPPSWRRSAGPPRPRAGS